MNESKDVDNVSDISKILNILNKLTIKIDLIDAKIENITEKLLKEVYDYDSDFIDDSEADDETEDEDDEKPIKDGYSYNNKYKKSKFNSYSNNNWNKDYVKKENYYNKHNTIKN